MLDLILQRERLYAGCRPGNLLDSTTSAITVFAPTDDAFAALASALSLTSEELLSKSDLLSVVRREFKAADVL